MGKSRVLSSIVVALAITLLSSGPALAGRIWCATDPILEFANGTRVQWTTRFLDENVGSLTGPVVYWIEVPENIGRIKVHFPASTVPEQVTISYTGEETEGRAFTVRAYVTVNASTKFLTYASVRGNVRTALDVAGQSGTRMKLVSVVDGRYWQPLEAEQPIVSTKTFTRTATTVGP
ncbi:MAG: hypothetical protein ACRDG6_00205 [Candidatus Limnocylindria bacterium]